MDASVDILLIFLTITIANLKVRCPVLSDLLVRFVSILLIYSIVYYTFSFQFCYNYISSFARYLVNNFFKDYIGMFKYSPLSPFLIPLYFLLSDPLFLSFKPTLFRFHVAIYPYYRLHSYLSILFTLCAILYVPISLFNP